MTSNPQMPVLVVDDEKETLQGTELLLLSLGISNVLLVQESIKIPEILKEQKFSLALLDLMMPDCTGEDLLEIIQANHPDLPVIIITGANDVQTAVRCMKKGAYDFFLKPIDREVFAPAIMRALEKKELTQEISLLKKRILNKDLEHPEAFQRIITNNERMFSIFSYLEAVAPGTESVLITGENGTGKELVARAVHDLSGVPGEFTAVNVAGLDDTLFSDTLFGHKKGAFTEASSPRKGLVEKAYDGTLFLDEIGELSAQSQIKLLRLLQEKEFFPLGSDLPQRTNARIIVATNKDLGKEMTEKNFRPDLFYRLNTHSIELPPLRERMDDIPLLLDHFLEQAGKMYNKKDIGYDADFLEMIMSYGFPGNVRELRSLVYDVIVLVAGNILSGDVISKKLNPRRNGTQMQISAGALSFPGVLPSLKEATDLVINEALRRTGNNQSKAARLLGITHQALSKRLKGR